MKDFTGLKKGDVVKRIKSMDKTFCNYVTLDGVYIVTGGDEVSITIDGGGDKTYSINAFELVESSDKNSEAGGLQEECTFQEEYTGGSSSYYSLYIANPLNKNQPSYTVECQDIITALNMNFATGNIFKAIWRMCAAMLGKRKKGYDNGKYDLEKVVFYGNMLLDNLRKNGK